MAFKSAPTEDTYSSERIHLSREINARDGGSLGRDEDLMNVFVEPVKNKAVSDSRHFIVKRSGASEVVSAIPTFPVRGWFFWEDQYKLFYCVDNNIQVYNVVTDSSATITDPFTSTSGEVGFCLFQYDDGTSKVVATDGTRLITIDSSNTVVTNVDADLPVHLPQPIYLDGYIFVVKTGTAEIYNSVLNDPLSWEPTDFIVAEMEGDNLTAIAKLNNYIVAFGTNSIEYFWDAANATGSPLQRNDTPIKLNTYLSGLAQFGNTLYFVGVNEGGKPNVYMLKDFKLEEVGTSTISRYLSSVTSPMSSWTSGIVSFKGHTFYVVNAGTDRTYVYDVETKLWARWGWQANERFDLTRSISVTSLINTYSYFTIGSSSAIYSFSDLVNSDNGTIFPCVITTEAENFGTLNRKTMRRATVIGDRPGLPIDITMQWSDDDGQTYNTGHTFNLNQDLPCTYRLGSFRQRSFKLTYSSATAFRIQHVEVEINKGR